ncbi:hypothetical protein [Rugosimonospora africana]|uniref:Uncharacterized protein n=1 Tax=Rugosimonospora africana TaxID=556532 RepID=A0A8J3QSK7_9ACTN|nr:hypothetical protein [Rugosimonospora africana]GIH16680.1 hypothetical protein Raf01_48520 [Rugosimonospora africana]
MSKTVAVVLDDDHWFWAYDVSLAILAVEVIQLVEAAGLNESWVDDLLDGLRRAVIVQGTYGLHVPADMTEAQRERLQALFIEAAQRLRARGSMTPEQVARGYEVDGHRVFLRGASTIDTSQVAEVADAIVDLVRGQLPPSPPGTHAWFYGTDGTPCGL